MGKRRDIANTVGGTLVVVGFIYFLLLMGSMFTWLFWATLLLAGVVILSFNVANIRGISWNLSPRAIIITNFSLSAFLLALYFFIFGLSSGFYWSAITLGIPIFIGVVFLVMDTIYLIKKDSIKRGMRGFSFGLVACIYIAVMLMINSNLGLAPPQDTASEVINQEENKILKLVLEEIYGKRSGCVMISPETTMNNGEYDNDYLERIKEEIYQYSSFHLKYGVYSFRNNYTFVRIGKTEFEELVNRFIEENRHPHTLTIPSSLEKGYYVDYEKRYSWYPLPIWHLTHPGSGPIVKVSSPVYDEKSGLMIIYIGTNDKTIYFLKYRYGVIETIGSFDF